MSDYTPLFPFLSFHTAGNEGPLDTFVSSTGLIWEHAEEFGALVVFAEVIGEHVLFDMTTCETVCTGHVLYRGTWLNNTSVS